MPLHTFYKITMPNGNVMELPASNYSAAAVESIRQSVSGTLNSYERDLPDPIDSTEMGVPIIALPILLSDPKSPGENEAWILQKSDPEGTANGMGNLTNANVTLRDEYYLKVNLTTGIKQTPLQ